MDISGFLKKYVWLPGVLLCFGILVSTSSPAQKVFDFNDRCRQAYQEIIRLKLSSGQQLIDLEKKAHPDNLIPYFLENYIDLFILFFNEDPAEYKAREKREEERLSLMDSGPAASPFYLFTKSTIHFQWAAIKIKFGSNWNAGWEFRRSFLQGKENQKKFPSFSPNAMLNGSMQVAAGTIPDGYKWLSSLLGINGSVQAGMRQLRQFLDANDSWAILYREEAIFYYLYLDFYIGNRREEVFTFISEHKLDLVNNHLFTYLAANLGVNGQRSAYAEKVLEAKNNSPLFMNMPVWQLEMGYVKLNHLDPEAGSYLKKFVEAFKGKFYVKDVLQKLSWFYFLRDDQQMAEYYRSQILSRGSTDTEADKQALKEARSGRWPDKLLLKARLLNDGGYHKEALGLLQAKDAADFRSEESKLEFTYRLGRLYDDLGRKEEAINAYRQTLDAGANSKEYFAARSALQTGYIYESRGDKANASLYFRKCIALKDHDYKNALDQKAKAGIARCEGD